MHAERDIVYQLCLSVRLSIAGTVSKPLDIRMSHTVTLFLLPGRVIVLVFLQPHRCYKIPRGTPQRALNTRGGNYLANIAIFLGNGKI